MGWWLHMTGLQGAVWWARPVGAVLLAGLTVAGCGDFDGIEKSAPAPSKSSADVDPSPSPSLRFGPEAAGCRVAFTRIEVTEGEAYWAVDGYAYTRCARPPRSHRATVTLELRDGSGRWRDVGHDLDAAPVRRGKEKVSWAGKAEGIKVHGIDGPFAERGSYRMRYEADLRTPDGAVRHVGPYYSPVQRIEKDPLGEPLK